MDGIEPGVTGRKTTAQLNSDAPTLGDDLLFGAKAIAEWMNCSERQIYYWKKIKRFGLFSVGDKVVGRKSTIAAEMARFERGTTNNA